MSELYDEEFKVTVINVFKILMVKVDSVQYQMSNFSRELKIVR